MSRRRSAGPRGRSRKGISTIVGMAIFFMLFALALTTVYSWQMMLAEYSEVQAQQLSLDRLRVSERLDVDIINSTALLLTNPSSQTVRVLHVLSGNQPVWDGSFDVMPFSSSVLYLSKPGGDIYRVVTLRGNVFSAGLDDERSAVAKQGWHVTFLVNETQSSFASPYAWGNSTVVGETYWYNTNLDWEWDFKNKAFGNRVVPANASVGFVATTTLVKVVEEAYDATINYLIDTGDSNFDRSRVALMIDGVVMRPLPYNVWYDASHYVCFTLTGPLYSIYEVSVYFYGQDVEVQRLSLNVVNATFAP